ncbi:MAG: hypothetical protein IJC88_05365, partial [Oscillospiraceae bacterium]|nr:hypothetical protein [Oscillospiraceae bacterium]
SSRTAYIQNARGDVVGHVNTLTTAIDFVDYDAYGNFESSAPSDPLGYCGEYRDAETGFIYLRARYYDPNLGRFTTEDPARDGLNWYVYCNNNPVNFVDPTGYITQEEIDMYENGELGEDVYKLLLDLTSRWNSATTEEGKREIHNLAETFRRNNYRYQDWTLTAYNQLLDNAQTIIDTVFHNSHAGYLIAGLDWYSLVKNYGEWDYKKNPASWMPIEDGYFVMFGQVISFADFGNINYGFTGTVLGLNSVTLYEGAGYVQSGDAGVVNHDPMQFYGDSEVDFWNVTRGIQYAKSKGYVGFLKLPVEIIFR